MYIPTLQYIFEVYNIYAKFTIYIFKVQKIYFKLTIYILSLEYKFAVWNTYFSHFQI